MKPVKTMFRPFLLLVPVLAVYLISISSDSRAQGKDEKLVKVKVVKTVDGKTTTVEKTMDEASVKDFTKQFENIEGKNVQVMITVESSDDQDKSVSVRSSGKNKSASSMHFNFDWPEGENGMDSAMARSFSKMFMFHDSIGNDFTWNDSLFKNLPNFPKDFNFNFNFDDKGEMKDFDFDINTDDDGKTVIINNNGKKTIIRNGEEEDGDGEEDDTAVISRSESGNGTSKTKTKTIVIGDDKNKSKKKVIVSTSVVVMDMDDEKEHKSGKRKSKENSIAGEKEDNFKFYPNPSDGNFVLDLDLNGKDEVSVLITDMNGKEVYKEKISGSGKTSKTIDLGNDKSGTFIVIIKQGKKTSSKKIIIE